MTGDGGWVLAEFVGGPRHATLAKVDGSELGDYLIALSKPAAGTVGRYVESSVTADPADDSLRFVDDERRAIARLGRGSPELYLRLIWTDSPDAPPSKRFIPAGDQGSGGGPADLLLALLAGDESGALTVARRHEELASGSTEMLDTLLAPVLRTIGRHWQEGDISIYAERRATGIARRIVADPIRPMRLAVRGRAITAVLTGETHGLPSEMAAEALDDDGWTVDRLGLNTPAELLVNEVDPGSIDLVVLSPTLPSNQAASRVTAGRLRERGIAVLVGGPGRPLAELQRQARAIRV